MKYSYRVTVFTPTYNRAYILPELYSSLKRQSCQDFEWLIVDDGSTDNTAQIVSAWLKDKNGFDIQYYKKENGGKHRAINDGLKRARGELFFIVDSDDYLPDTSIETLIHFRDELPSEPEIQYCGVAGCKGYTSGNLIGTTFVGEYIDCSSIERGKHNIEGDKAEAFFTEILRQYPFPEFDGEKFVTEAAVWDRMALDGYQLRYYNKTIYLAEYREDGLTHQGLDLYYRNPQGYGYYLRQCRKCGKFSKALQAYFDAECYLNWHQKMSLKEVAVLIGAKPLTLAVKVALHQLRQYASRCKQFLIRVCKRGKS